MGTVIFVHGTGLRDEAYTRTLAIVGGEIAASRPDVVVEGCPWGDTHGARLKSAASIPTYATTRAAESAVVLDEEAIALWEVLYADPLFELRLLAQRAPEPLDLAPGEAPPWLALDRALGSFKPSPQLNALLAQSHLTGILPNAVTDVAESDACGKAILSVGEGAAEHRVAIAHAVVATAIVEAADRGIPPPGARVRDEIVALIAAGLGGDERGVGAMLAAPVKGFALRLVTRYATRRRGALTDIAYPAVGDIMFYQARGAGICEFIEDRIARAQPPVTLLAHSLGGIACVDLLVAKPLASVTHVITVGSQAPFLYEIDALRNLRYGEALPAHFPAWLNIYDPRDILSYIVEGLSPFKDRAKDTRDVEVRSGQPFPQSHSAYWTNPRVWDAVLSVVP